MSIIGRVLKRDDNKYEGYIKTLTISKNIDIVPIKDGTEYDQPDYRVMAGDVEVGVAWNKKDQVNGDDYVSLSLVAPEFGNSIIHAHLKLDAVSTNDKDFAIMWHPSN